MRKPPLVWSIEFMKKVHVASNDTAPACVPFRGPKPTFSSFEVSLAAWRYCHLAGSALASRLGLALLIDADAFGALGRVRMYRGSGINIDGSTRYLAGVVDRYAHPDQQSHSED